MGRATSVAEHGRNLAVWARDYAYAVGRQAVGILHHHGSRAYRRPDARWPAIVLIPGI